MSSPSMLNIIPRVELFPGAPSQFAALQKLKDHENLAPIFNLERDHNQPRIRIDLSNAVNLEENLNPPTLMLNIKYLE